MRDHANVSEAILRSVNATRRKASAIVAAQLARRSDRIRGRSPQLYELTHALEV
jgi:hypothetical protein